MSYSSVHADLVLFNARVLTLGERRSTAQLVAMQGDRIAGVGSDGDLRGLSSRNTTAIDCSGQTLVPGFIDAHCHLMAYAAGLLAVDCGKSAVSSIADIKGALSQRARETPQGQWLRGKGYDEFFLEEKRHPTRWDLDDAVPDHPMRLNHRSGHACVLNSAALARVGITTETADPPGGWIERDFETGEPTGVLFEMDGYLDGTVPPLDERELQKGIQIADRRLVSAGITSVQDATHSNSLQRWEAFKRLKDDASLTPRVTMMVGADHLQAFGEGGLGFGSGDSGLNVGAVKVMLSGASGTLWPSPRDLRALVLRAHDAGFQVAVHAVEADAVEAAAEALLGEGRLRPRDRIEHCSECPPTLLDKLQGSGLIVVTQPAFLYHSGRRYLSDVAQEMQPWLYRVGSFEEVGLRPAASSDAPVSDPHPLLGVYAAVTRRADTGETVGETERVSTEQALRMHTINGAYASFQESQKGSIEVGKLADLVLLDRDPTAVAPDDLPHINVAMTIVGGKVVWEE